jgi:acyl-CoA synthetase (AMP-forming)/AMP-acid ligase II
MRRHEERSMILGDRNGATIKAETFDALFRRAGVRRSDALALVDAPNRSDRAPRKLTYGEADRVISGLALRLRALGLMSDSIVALQFGNTVESVLALLAVIRAGMIAVPLPVLWRQEDIVEALAPLGPKAVITTTRIGACNHAEVAMRVAAELFPVRYVCAFGDNVPDGVVPLEDLFDAALGDLSAVPRREHPAAHVAVVTPEINEKGFAAVGRNQAEMMAGGAAVYGECGTPQDATILSSIPVASFAGIAAVLVPWLRSGGTLHLHHGFDGETFAVQRQAAKPDTIVVPGPVIERLTAAGQLKDAARVVALWRAPERLAAATAWQSEALLVDVTVFGETALVARRRGNDGLPRPLPLGAPRAPAAGTSPLLETKRTKAGHLAVRGAMVPVGAFPPGVDEKASAIFAPDEAGFVETDYTCRRESDGQSLTITGSGGGLACVGGYSLRSAAIEARLAKIDAEATLVAVPDALLGQRLAGQGRERTAAFLQAFGLNALIASAFSRRKPAA